MVPPQIRHLCLVCSRMQAAVAFQTTSAKVELRQRDNFQGGVRPGYNNFVVPEDEKCVSGALKSYLLAQSQREKKNITSFSKLVQMARFSFRGVPKWISVARFKVKKKNPTTQPSLYLGSINPYRY